MKFFNEEITKVKIKKIIQTILNNSNLNEWLNEEEHEIILELLKNHPNYNTKKGNGIKGFKIQYNHYKKRGFYLYRIDGTFTDFSYLQCLNPQTLLFKIKKACRNSIQEYIISFKIRSFQNSNSVKCEISGKELTFNTCEVDHYNPTFKEIFEEWISNKKITYGDINNSQDNNELTSFTNKELNQSFKEFHNKVANLRILSPEINRELERGKNEIISKI